MEDPVTGKKGATRKRANERRKAKHPKVLLIVALLGVIGLGVWRFWPQAPPSAGGTPELALDRTEISLGYLRFNAPAYAAFTISNRGDGPLTLQAGPVRVVEGC
jgi:hypothetical protein